MSASLAVSVLLVLVGLVLIMALLMFGKPVVETFAAVFRIFGQGIARGLVWCVNAVMAVSWYFLAVGALTVTVVGGLVYVYWIKPAGLDLHGVRPPACTELLDRKGAVLDYICPFDGVRIWRPLEAISTNLRVIVVMLEDDKFYEHGGLDIDEIWNSLETDLEKRKLARGGSTITQQLAKNLFLTKEKSLFRKASEIPLALRLERELDKDEILELYLNTIEWGPGIYGAEAASRLYFDHEASHLSDEEAWLLALMIPNPKELNLWLAPRARRSLLGRARHLATRLYQEHHMSKDEASQALLKFEAFITNWQSARPVALRGGRHFPARWQNEHAFSLAEIVSVRRGAAGLLKRYKQAPMRLNIDLAIQEQLEAISRPAHAHDLSDVVALMEGDAIRAMVPATKSTALEQVQKLSDSQGLKAQVFHARSIPSQALWP